METLSTAERRRLHNSMTLIQQAVQAPTDEAASENLTTADLPQADRAALASVDPRRLLVYRHLVRSTLRDAIQMEIPRAVERANDFNDLFTQFCAQQLPCSQVLRDVAYEFAAWAAGRSGWRPLAADIARYELLEFDVHTAPRLAPGGLSEELSPNHPVAFDSSVRLGRFDFAVHQLDEDDHVTQPAAGSFALLSYRDTENTYRELELSSLASEIVAPLLFDNLSLATAIQQGCANQEQTLNQTVVDGISEVLTDLQQRGALLGSSNLAARKAPPSHWFIWLQRGDFEQRYRGPAAELKITRAQ